MKIKKVFNDFWKGTLMAIAFIFIILGTSNLSEKLFPDEDIGKEPFTIEMTVGEEEYHFDNVVKVEVKLYPNYINGMQKKKVVIRAVKGANFIDWKEHVEDVYTDIIYDCVEINYIKDGTIKTDIYD